MHRFMKLLRCDSAAGAIEYALVASLIAIAAYGAYQNLGSKTDAMFNNVSNAM